MFYYDNAERGFRAHDTLGLYKNKSVRAIGKVMMLFIMSLLQRKIEVSTLEF